MKKLNLMILAIVLSVMVIFTGCGGQTVDTSEETKSSSVEDTAVVEPATVAEADPFFGKYEEPVTLNLAVPTNSATEWLPNESPKNNVWTRSWKEDFNVETNIMWEAIDVGNSGTYEMKMNLAIASNELPDIMRLKSYSQFDKLVNAGMIEDLTSYYEKYAYPMLKENVMSGGGQELEWGKVDGKLMGFPDEGINYQGARMVFIRHDWFEKTGLPAPKTLEDVLAIAKAMQQQDPKNRFALPLMKTVVGDNFCDIVGLANAIGAYPSTWVDDGSGKLVYGSTQPQMKKALQIYADLYKQKMIDPAFASLDGGKVGEQLTGGKIGVVLGAFWIPSWPLNALWDTDGVDWDIYPLLKSVENTGDFKVQTDPPKGKMVVVRKGYEHPELLFKLLNYTVAKIYDPEKADTLKYHSDPKDPNHAAFGYNPLYVMWGPVKTNFNTNPNVTNAIEKNDTSYLKTPHDQTQYENIKTKYLDVIAAGKKPEGAMWGVYKFFYGPNSSFGALNQYFADDSFIVTKLAGYQTPEMVRSWANLVKLEEQYIAEIIAGVKPVDDFDKFVTDWKNLGGELIEVEANNWYKTKK